MPETVVEGQFVLQLLRLVNAGVRILPLEGGEASKEEHRDGDTWVESGRVGHSSHPHTVISGQALHGIHPYDTVEGKKCPLEGALGALSFVLRESNTMISTNQSTVSQYLDQ